MKVEELRMGNFINVPTFDNERTDTSVEGIDLVNDFPLEYNIQTIHVMDLSLSQCEPIPLTEEWLLKFGFEFKKTTKYYVNNYFHCFYGVTDETKGKIIFATNLKKRIFIDYVHQLQNLYFALTGEELKLKENV